MALTSDVIARFVKAAKVEETKKPDTTVYGTIVDYEGRKYVRIDGSELLTPVSSAASADDGERVSVSIKNHSAVVTGNMSSPAARTDDVTEIGNQISKFEIVVADKVSVKELDAQIARIDELVATDVTIKGTLNAANANIEKLTAKDAEITGTLIANKAEIDELFAKKIDAELVKATYAEIGELEALRIDVRDLDASFGDFQELTAQNFDAVNGTIENLDATYANIDFANIGEAALKKIFSESGLIKDLIVGDTTISGELVGVTIKGDLIEAGTLRADKLVVKGTDGAYYKLNLDGMGASTQVVAEDQIHGKTIVAKSITAEKITVKDLVAFGANIAGFKIDNDAIRSLVKDGPLNATRGIYMDNNGQFSVGDSTHFIRFYDAGNGVYKLEITADSMTLGGRTKTVETELGELSSLTTAAKLAIDSINKQISMLVQDNNGESLMTQTPDGWTFKTTGIQNSVDTLSSNLGSLMNSVGNTEQTVNILNQTINDLRDTTEYIRIRVYEDEPCIELGESDSDFKLLVTNTRIMFLDGTGAVPTYIDRTGVITDNIEVKSTIRQGNFSWLLRPNGHLSLHWDATPPLTYGVEHTLTNITSSNQVLIATSGRTYKTILIPNVGYEVKSVKVMMSDVDITAASWDPSTNKIEVEDVTGRIYVEATGTIINWSVTRNLTNVTAQSTVTSLQYGTALTDKLSITSSYIFGHVSITMGGKDITSSAYNATTGDITINKATGNIVITATAVSKTSTFTVTNTLTNMTSNNSASSAKAGTQYIAALSVGDGYTINTVTVSMGGYDITSKVYDSSNKSITIPSVTGNIVVTAKATPTVYNVYRTLDCVTSSNYANTATHGTSYNTTLAPLDGYYISSVTVSMGIIDVTSSVYNSSTGVIDIASVNGAIVITAEAEPYREIEVTVDSGSTVTATKSGVTKTGTANGSTYTISGLTPGTWTVKATKSGKKATSTVTISSSSTTLTYYTTLIYKERYWIVQDGTAVHTNVSGITIYSHVDGTSDVDPGYYTSYVIICNEGVASVTGSVLSVPMKDYSSIVIECRCTSRSSTSLRSIEANGVSTSIVTSSSSYYETKTLTLPTNAVDGNITFKVEGSFIYGEEVLVKIRNFYIEP